MTGSAERAWRSDQARVRQQLSSGLQGIDAANRAKYAREERIERATLDEARAVSELVDMTRGQADVNARILAALQAVADSTIAEARSAKVRHWVTAVLATFAAMATVVAAVLAWLEAGAPTTDPASGPAGGGDGDDGLVPTAGTPPRPHPRART